MQFADYIIPYLIALTVKRVFLCVVPSCGLLALQLLYLCAANAVFSVGHECPKFEVPGPESTKEATHMKGFLQMLQPNSFKLETYSMLCLGFYIPIV